MSSDFHGCFSCEGLEQRALAAEAREARLRSALEKAMRRLEIDCCQNDGPLYCDLRAALAPAPAENERNDADMSAHNSAPVEAPGAKCRHGYAPLLCLADANCNGPKPAPPRVEGSANSAANSQPTINSKQADSSPKNDWASYRTDDYCQKCGCSPESGHHAGFGICDDYTPPRSAGTADICVTCGSLYCAGHLDPRDHALELAEKALVAYLLCDDGPNCLCLRRFRETLAAIAKVKKP